jgi:hypothetical protein
MPVCTSFDKAPLVLSLRLHFVGVHDGHQQTWKAFLDFGAARRVAHLDASTFTPNQTRLPEGFEVL